MTRATRDPRVPRRGAEPAYSRAETVAVVQGALYAATEVWPILHLRSFEAVTGPTREGWLVKTVGGLVGVAGAALMASGLRRRVTPEMAMLGAGSAVVLAAIDVVYVAKRRISPVYYPTTQLPSPFSPSPAIFRGIIRANLASEAGP